MAEAVANTNADRHLDVVGVDALAAKYADIEGRLGTDFVTYHPETAGRTMLHPTEAETIPDETTNVKKYVRQRIMRLLSGEVEQVVFAPDILNVITVGDLREMEIQGVSFSGVSPEHPDGGIAIMDMLQPGFLPVEGEPFIDSKIRSIVAHRVLGSVVGHIQRRPSPGLPEKLNGLPRIPVNASVAAVCKDGKWSKSAVLPDGQWLVEGFDHTAWQYAQGVFEGMVATKNGEVVDDAAGVQIEAHVEDGRITIFRQEENARRFIKSCERMGLPPISVDQFIQAVIAAVKNNKKFIPKDGKLYVRPFMVGLKGGTGVHPAKECLFAVEVSPYGEYLSKKAEEAGENPSDDRAGLRLKKIGSRRTAKVVTYPRGINGHDKIAPNYGPIMALREAFIKEGFADILLVDNGHVQEFSSSNLFTVKHQNGGNGKKKFVLSTPPLSSNALPGINRKSLLEALRDPKIQEMIGCEIEVRDDESISEQQLNPLIGADGIFSTGTAAGVSGYDAIESRGVNGDAKIYEYKANPNALNELVSSFIASARAELDDCPLDIVNLQLTAILAFVREETEIRGEFTNFQIKNDPENFEAYLEAVATVLNSLYKSSGERMSIVEDKELVEVFSSIDSLSHRVQSLKNRRRSLTEFNQLINDFTLEDDPKDPEAYVVRVQAFLDGLTANGAVAIETIQLISEQLKGFNRSCKDYLDDVEKYASTKGFIEKIKQLLINLRKGKVPGYEKWAMVVE